MKKTSKYGKILQGKESRNPHSTILPQLGSNTGIRRSGPRIFGPWTIFALIYIIDARDMREKDDFCKLILQK
jgi:hypothetical protein